MYDILRTNLATNTISHSSQLLNLQSVFEMVNNNINNWINSCRVMTSKPFRQVDFPTEEIIRTQRITTKEIGHDSEVTFSCEVVCHELNILVDGTKDVTEYEDGVAIWIGGTREIGWY